MKLSSDPLSESEGSARGALPGPNAMCKNFLLVRGNTPSPIAPKRRRARWLAGAAAFAASLTLAHVTCPGSAQGALRRLRVPNLQGALARLTLPKKLTARSLTPELRQRGYGECFPYDFVGLGPYAPYRRLRVGRIAIPQEGGHTPDYGYDVVVHFHGQTALRMTLAQVAGGVAFVGIDLGNGSGPYADEFASKQSWPLLREDIERTLKAHSGHAEAHIRHLALSAWSAGYGAVNEILKYHADSIDAVVLLDGLHAGWDPRVGRGTRVENVTAGPIAPTVEFARQAAAGEKLFVFTYSEIDPVLYPSTSLTGQYLMKELGLAMNPEPKTTHAFGLRGAVDVMGLHVWSFSGNDKPAHCSHLAHIERAVRDIIEPAWETPAMNRQVPSTPAPQLGPVARPAVAPSSSGEVRAERSGAEAPSSQG